MPRGPTVPRADSSLTRGRSREVEHQSFHYRDALQMAECIILSLHRAGWAPASARVTRMGAQGGDDASAAATTASASGAAPRPTPARQIRREAFVPHDEQLQGRSAVEILRHVERVEPELCAYLERSMGQILAPLRTAAVQHEVIDDRS